MDFQVDTVQDMWRTGDIPQELGCTILFLIRKGTTNTRDIGLLVTLWKVAESLTDTRQCVSLQLHGVLYRFRARRGTGTAIMDLNLAQELSRVDCDLLFMVFLELSKAYDTVDRYCLIQTLERYGVVPLMCGLLENFWSHQKMMPKQNCYHGLAFPYTQGMTQGGLTSLTLFKVVMENFIQKWLVMTVEDQRVAHDGMLEAVG